MFERFHYKKDKILLENMEDQRALPPSIWERIFAGIPLLLMVGVFVAAGISITAVYLSQEKTLRALEAEEIRVSSHIQSLTKQRQKLEKELEDMSSPLYIEKQAREKLKMVKPGETVYVDIRKNP